MAKHNHTFLKFMKDIIESGTWAKLSAAARTLYPVLCHYSDETFKHVWPGTEELLQKTGFKTKRSLQQAKRELQQIGLIDFTAGSGRTPSRYYFRFDYENSRVDLESYRDTTVSRRVVQEGAAEGAPSEPKGGAGVSPNQIHININNNQTEQQTQLLQGLHDLVEQFLKTSNADDPPNREQIINNLLGRYGQLETGEAIKIAMGRGRDGDIRYLEGILRNRKNGSEAPTKRSGGADRHFTSLKEKLPASLQQDFEKLKFHYECDGVNYFTTLEQVQKEGLEDAFAELGRTIKVFVRHDELPASRVV